MREVTGDPWTWDDGTVVARAAFEGGDIYDRFPGVKQVLADRAEANGAHLSTFQPNPDRGRPYWLLVLPTKTHIERVCSEILVWTLAVLPEGGTVVVPPLEGHEGVLEQPVRFEDDELRSCGERFVVVKP